jgi:RsiW-degrading membrane proteinase PrsW (M82 family)
MAISFVCECGKVLRARDEVAGKKAKCPQCGTVLLIPEPDGGYGLAELAPKHEPARGGFDDESALRPISRTAPIPTPPSPSANPPRPSLDWSAPSRQKPAATSAPSSTSGGSGEHSLMEYAYLLLAFALIPLVISLLGGDDKSDVGDRIMQTLANATPEQLERAKPLLERLERGDESVTKKDLLSAMPDGRLAGAHLAHDSTLHWVYAGIASVAFLLLISLFFSVERVNPVSLFLIGLFTGTVGIIFLFVVQFCSQIRLGRIHGRGWFMLVFLMLAFIGWSYRSALDPDSNFLLSSIGFTFGVGLCEEYTKAIPLFFYFKNHAQMGWRGACLWGLASGIGFGVSEGVMYASDHYNGLSGPDIYLVRFISCVALHAMWSASVGIAIARNVDEYEQVSDAGGFMLFMLRIIAVPMILHGFYDTLLKKDMNGWALGVALLSFGWLALHIEMARGSHPHAGTGRRKFAY